MSRQQSVPQQAEISGRRRAATGYGVDFAAPELQSAVQMAGVTYPFRDRGSHNVHSHPSPLGPWKQQATTDGQHGS